MIFFLTKNNNFSIISNSTRREWMKMQKFTDKQKGILYLSLIFMMISTGMQLDDFYAKQDSYTISYEYVNIKDMSQAKIKNKVNHTTIQTKIEEKETQEQGAVEEIELEKKVEEVPLTETQETEEIKPKEIWHLPIEIGQITQYPHSGHVAYDMTSYRKMDEVIHPIANGKISGIYTDSIHKNLFIFYFNLSLYFPLTRPHKNLKFKFLRSYRKFIISKNLLKANKANNNDFHLF